MKYVPKRIYSNFPLPRGVRVAKRPTGERFLLYDYRLVERNKYSPWGRGADA